MESRLNYIEERLKEISGRHPDYFDHILSDKELAEYIGMLIREYSIGTDEHEIIEATASSNMLSDYFNDLQNRIVYHKQGEEHSFDFASIYQFQTEDLYIPQDFDISYSRIIRYLPAQWHTDNFFQIYYASDKDCMIHFYNEQFRLKPGYLMIISPDVTHATPCYDDGCILEHFFLRASTFDRVFFDQLGTVSILSHFFRRALDFQNTDTAYLVFDTDKDRDIEHIIDVMISEATQQLPYKSNLMNSLMAQLFILLLRRYEHTARMPLIGDVRWKHEFSEILAYIQNNYSSVTQAELTDRFAYSARQINRIIHSCLNMSYAQLITFLRMQKAAEMLKKGHYSMEYISQYLGYNNLSSFYRTFKKYYRLTPIQYIQQNIV